MAFHSNVVAQLQEKYEGGHYVQGTETWVYSHKQVHFCGSDNDTSNLYISIFIKICLREKLWHWMCQNMGIVWIGPLS